MNQEIKTGNPAWLFLAIPIFFLVWYFAGIGYAFIAGPGAVALLFVVFVWLPNDEARKLMRKEKFAEVKDLIDDVPSKLRIIKDNEIVKHVGQGVLVFNGLIKNLESKGAHQGKIEEKLLPTVQDLMNLLSDWIGHESGEYPLEPDKAKRTRGILVHFDDLVLKYQKDGIAKTDTLTSLFELESDMQAAGINPEEGK